MSDNYSNHLERKRESSLNYNKFLAIIWAALALTSIFLAFSATSIVWIYILLAVLQLALATSYFLNYRKVKNPSDDENKANNANRL